VKAYFEYLRVLVQEYFVLQTSEIDVLFLLDLPENVKRAIGVAASALYLDDGSDYKNALYSVLLNLTQIESPLMNDEMIQSISNLFNMAD